MKAFELDPNSRGIGFSIVRLAEEAADVTLPIEVVRKVNRLLRKQENIYQDAITAIEECRSLQDTDIGEQLSKYRSTLNEIREYQVLITKLSGRSAAYDIAEAQTDQLIERIRAIKNRSKDVGSVMETQEFQVLCNSIDIQKVKEQVVSRIQRRFPHIEFTRQYLCDSFENTLAELILSRVDSASLNRPSSLAYYCGKTIPSILANEILLDKYGLSYSQFGQVQRKQKVEQKIYHEFGRKPQDQQIAAVMKISLARLRQINDWERQIERCSVDEQRDSSSSEDEKE